MTQINQTSENGIFRYKAWNKSTDKIIYFDFNGGKQSVYGYEGEICGILLPDDYTCLMENDKGLNADLAITQCIDKSTDTAIKNTITATLKAYDKRSRANAKGENIAHPDPDSYVSVCTGGIYTLLNMTVLD